MEGGQSHRGAIRLARFVLSLLHITFALQLLPFRGSSSAMSSTPDFPLQSLPPIPPSIHKLLAGNVNLLVVETVFPTLLVPITIGLFVFSTPKLRRKPVFILNIVAMVLGLVLGGISIYTQVS